MEKKNYTQSFISTCELLGGFWTTHIYNDLYQKSINKVREDSKMSITDVYRSTLMMYINCVCTHKDIYMHEIKLLHAYYQMHTNLTTIVFSDFENRVLEEFIPPSYYKDLTSSERDKILYSIVTRLVQNLGVKVNEVFIKFIIDDHANRLNPRIIQDFIVDSLIIQREEFYATFARKSLAGCEPKVSMEVVNKMKTAIISETQRRCKAEADLSKALNIIHQLSTKINELEMTPPGRASNPFVISGATVRDEPWVTEADAPWKVPVPSPGPPRNDAPAATWTPQQRPIAGEPPVIAPALQWDTDDDDEELTFDMHE